MEGVMKYSIGFAAGLFVAWAWFGLSSVFSKTLIDKFVPGQCYNDTHDNGEPFYFKVLELQQNSDGEFVKIERRDGETHTFLTSLQKTYNKNADCSLFNQAREKYSVRQRLGKLEDRMYTLEKKHAK